MLFWCNQNIINESKKKKLPKIKYKKHNVQDLKELPQFEDENEDVRIIRTKEIFKNSVTDYHVYCKSGEYDLIIFLSKISEIFFKTIEDEMNRKDSITIKFIAVVQYIDVDEFGNQKKLIKTDFHSKFNQIESNDKSIIRACITEMKNNILSRSTNYTAQNTTYRFDRVLRLKINSDKYKPLRGGTYKELPKFIQNKKCCINVKNIKNNKFKCEKKRILDVSNMH